VTAQLASAMVDRDVCDPNTASAPGLAETLVIALTPGLSVTRSLFRRTPRYILSDPMRGAHCAISPDVWSLLSGFTGTATLAHSLQLLHRSQRPVPPLATLLPTLARLRDLGLVRIVKGALPVPEAQKAAQPFEAKFVYYRRELIELTPFMPVVNTMIGWLFSRLGAAAWAALLLVAIFNLAQDWGRVENPLIWLTQLNAGEALLLYALTISIKIIHELSHAVAYRRMAAAEGVSVPSIRAGVAFMLFFPFPFTNCTGAWGISDKYRRAVVGLAGMYAETWIAIIALLVWSMTSNPIMSSLCLQIAMIVGLSTVVFNLNPLAKLDGYYVLTDLIERPNLQGQAMTAGMISLQRLFKVQDQEQRPAPADPTLVGYWIASSLYRWIIFSGMIWLAFSVSAWLAAPVALIAASLLIYRPLRMHCRVLLTQSADAAKTRRKLIGVGAAAIVALFILPLPNGQRAEAMAEMDGAAFVYAPREGRVVSVAPANGSGTLLVLEDPELPLLRRELAARRALAAVRYQNALAASGTNPRSVENARAIMDDVINLDRQLEKMDAEELRLTASGTPADRWNPLQSTDLIGSWISPNTDRPLGLNAARAPVQVRALIPEQNADGIAIGQNAKIRLGNSMAMSGAVTRIETRASDRLPTVALGRSGGGRIALNPDDQSGRTAQQKYINVWISISDAAQRARLHHGQILAVRFSEGARPLAWQLASALPALIKEHSPN
jgi:putative peptide zinc metalloprotease protein